MIKHKEIQDSRGGRHKLSLTNFDNGISVSKKTPFRDLSVVRWSVTVKASAEDSSPGYTLEESYEIRGSVSQWFAVRICGWGYHLMTRLLRKRIVGKYKWQ